MEYKAGIIHNRQKKNEFQSERHALHGSRHLSLLPRSLRTSVIANLGHCERSSQSLWRYKRQSKLGAGYTPANAPDVVEQIAAAAFGGLAMTWSGVDHGRVLSYIPLCASSNTDPASP